VQSHADAEEDRTAELIPAVRPSAPWRVADFEALPGFQLRVRFNDGTAGVVDMAAFIQSESAGVFASLHDERLFRQVKLSLGAVSWLGGLDLAPDAMHCAIKEHGTWTLE
jgi:hypothetical protein